MNFHFCQGARNNLMLHVSMFRGCTLCVKCLPTRGTEVRTAMFLRIVLCGRFAGQNGLIAVRVVELKCV